ncbi:MAG: cobalamin-dependent protein, partial [Bacteroidota bacterium]
MIKSLLIIPPLTQLNTPYPATAYLKGFLNSQGIQTRQKDLGLDMVLEVFSKTGLQKMFDEIESGEFILNHENEAIVKNRISYETTIDAVIQFLQNKNYTLAYRIANGLYLPEGPRFQQIKDLEWFFGNIGVQDKARYKCTMYLEDLSDLIQASVGPHFGFSKYAERIGRTAVSFTPIEEELEKPTSYLDSILNDQLAKYFQEEVPDLVGFTVPFGGNLYGALKAGQWIKRAHPNVKIVLGGGYANTELRELRDSRVFNYVDYITLDDGEGPILALINS